MASQDMMEPAAPRPFRSVRPPATPFEALLDLPEAAQGTVEVEGAIREDDLERRGQLTVWLFPRGKGLREVPLAEVTALARSEDNFLWIDLTAFTAAEMRHVAGVLGLPESLAQTALAPWQRPRLDIFGSVFSVLGTLPRIDRQAYRIFAGQIVLFVERNFLVSAHKQPPILSARILARARQNAELMREDASFLLYIYLDELLAYYEGLGEHVADEIERMEERALADLSDTYLEDVLRLKRYVFALARLANQHRALFATFLQPDFPFTLPARMAPYFRDLEARLLHLLGTLDAAKDAANGAFGIYVSHVSHRTNAVMRTLTIISALLLPATVILTFVGTQTQIAALYGGRGVGVLIACILVPTIVSLMIFRRKGWL